MQDLDKVENLDDYAKTSFSKAILQSHYGTVCFWLV